MITSSPQLFSSTAVLQSGFSDHLPIFGSLITVREKDDKHRVISTRKVDLNANHEDFRNALSSMTWDMMNIFNNPNDKLFIWENLFTPVMNIFFPVRRKRIRKNSYPWIDSSILVLMRNRDQARKKAFKSKSDEDFNIYKRLRNCVTSRLRKAKSDFFKRKLDDCRHDPKTFWKLMKKIIPSKNRTTKIDKLVVDGVHIVDPKSISDSLNIHFTSVATDLLSDRTPTSMPTTINLDSHWDTSSHSLPATFHFRPTTDVEISNMLTNLNPNKATGIDNIPAKILKISSNCISQSLSSIINSTFEAGIFPNKWKIAKISPISKGNTAVCRDNYRPISVLPCLSKICESCVNNQMNEHDQEFQTFFEPSQYAYKKHSSTVTALIQVLDSIKLAVDQKQYSVATFIDLRKAFDIIDHRILLARLTKYGFGEIEANWICSYLTGRQQYVVLNGVLSQLLPINYGVPQGSVLGPSLFCLLFNPIVDSFISSSPSLYADDVETHCSHSNLDVAQTQMNNDLKRVDQWLADNRMIPNVKKTKTMVIGSRQALKKAHKIEIYLDNKILDVVTTFDYLGVRINNILSWEHHIGRICQRLYPKFGLLNRISSFLPSTILLRIYKQTILPILDYGSTVWHECGTIQTRRVEKLQNRALRIILHEGRRKCSQQMRNELNLLSLHSRRRFLRFLSIFKILHNLNCPSQLKDTFKFRCCMHNRDLRDKTLLDLEGEQCNRTNNIQVCWCKRLELIACKH